MSDKPREWPNVAKEARDQSAERAVKGIGHLEYLMDNWGDITESEKLRRIGIAMASLQFIARTMEMVGAPTRPVS